MSDWKKEIIAHLKQYREEWMEHPFSSLDAGMTVHFDYDHDEGTYKFSADLEDTEQPVPSLIHEATFLIITIYNDWIERDIEDFKQNAEFGNIPFEVDDSTIFITFLNESVRGLIL